MRAKKTMIFFSVVSMLLLFGTIVGQAGVVNTSIETIVEKTLIRRNNNTFDASEMWYIQNKINDTINETFKNIPIKLHMKILYWACAFIMFFLTVGNEKTILGHVISLLQKIKGFIERFLSVSERKELNIKANNYVNSLSLSEGSDHAVLVLIVLILYEFSAFWFGHNNFTQVIVTLLTIWFVVPCCIVVDFMEGFTGGVFDWEVIAGMIAELFSMGGVFGLLLLPLCILQEWSIIFNIDGGLMNRMWLSVSDVYNEVFN
jgi:hypothetical protein